LACGKEFPRILAVCCSSVSVVTFTVQHLDALGDFLQYSWYRRAPGLSAKGKLYFTGYMTHDIISANFEQSQSLSVSLSAKF
jgi:hypothetical protein